MVARKIKRALCLGSIGVLLGLAGVASAQQKVVYWHNDPNVLVPPSSQIKPGVHKPVSCCLRFVGVPRANAVIVPPALRDLQQRLGYTNGAVPADTIAGYHPSDIRAAYGMPDLGGSDAIAIVDFNNLTSALSDFNTFSQQFGLPQETSSNPMDMNNKVFTLVYAEGTKPADDNQGWGEEIALDIEWAHAMAPNAKIFLVESASGDLDSANQVAAKLPGVKEVSNSWAYPGEVPGEQSLDHNYLHTGTVFFASSGDWGNIPGINTCYPAESPNVVGVGGTSLYVTNGQYAGESGWVGSGGGPSLYEGRPDFQNSLSGIIGVSRGSPDESAVADPYTGVAVYSSTAYGNGPTWAVIGGTSVACPVMAGMTNTRQHITSSSHRELERVYFNLGGLYYRDVINGGTGIWNNQKGWDFVTGIGTPNGLFPPPVVYIYPPKTGQVLTGRLMSGNLAALQQADGITYTVGSSLTSLGQTGTVELGDGLDRPLRAIPRGATLSLVSKAPLGTTLQLFERNFVTGKFDYIQAFPSTGAYKTITVPITASYVQNGTNSLDFVFRAIGPKALGSPPFNLAMDQLTLNEVIVPPWDVNEPL